MNLGGSITPTGDFVPMWNEAVRRGQMVSPRFATPVAEPTITEMPPEIREPLKKVAMEFGWYIGGVEEPAGSIRWFVFDREGLLLKTDVAVMSVEVV